MIRNYARSMIFCLSLALLFLASSVITSGAAAQGASGYHVSKTLAVGGDEGWDYVAVDSALRHVYVSHSAHVVVLDADSGAAVGDIPDTQGVHGIAIASGLGRGFTSNGRANTVTIFDLKTFKSLGTVKVGTNPDAIVYDGVTKRVFTLNGRSQDTTAVNAVGGSVAGTLALGGKPGFAVADGNGRIIVNNEGETEVGALAVPKRTLIHPWTPK